MLVNVTAAKCIGVDAVPVTVEVDINKGIGIHLVGLADTAVRESLLRTVTALQSAGFRIPGKKIVINLAPADVHKQGSGYDLPIALGIICASSQENLPGIGRFLIMGELGLDASVRAVPGALPMVELAVKMGMEGCILPAVSAMEAADYPGVWVYGVSTLSEVLGILRGEPSGHLLVKAPAETGGTSGAAGPEAMDWSEIVGQERAKRALEIAVSGGHNIIMIGSPGSGKTSLARALPSIMPPMDADESFVTSKIFSIAGLGASRLASRGIRPFRSPHYSASVAALIGGGAGDNIMPGEVSLASGGILFLDEFLLLPKTATEALRLPLEDRKVVISRLRAKVEYPADFMLVAAANPCPCGYYGDGDKCSCTPAQRLGYMSKLSGPMLDRIDIHLRVDSVPAGAIIRASAGRESSAQVAARVAAVRELQRLRFAGEGIRSNARMSHGQLKKFCPLDEECRESLERILERMDLSARAYTRIVKIARTIADMEMAENIRPSHLYEAAGYRFLDRQTDFI